MSQRNEIDRSNIYDLYNTYFEYKFYYDFYWEHQNMNNITKEDINKKIQNIIEQRSALNGPIEALCFYANIPTSDLFNNDGTPKDINELDTLKMIMEANYDKTDN